MIPRFADNPTLGFLRRVLSRFPTTSAGHGTTLEHHEEDLQCVDPRGAGSEPQSASEASIGGHALAAATTPNGSAASARK